MSLFALFAFSMSFSQTPSGNGNLGNYDVGLKFGDPIVRNSQMYNYGYSLEGDPQAVKLWEEIREKVYNKEMLKISDVKGSPYTFDAFVPAVVMYSGEKEKEFYARYNAYNDEVEFKEFNREGAPIYGLLKSPKISCIINGEELKYMQYSKEGEMAQGYLLKKLDGTRYSLFVKDQKTIRKKRTATNSLQRTFPARFADAKEFYIGGPGEAPTLLPQKKKKFLQMLDRSDREKATDYIKEHKVNLKDESQVVRLLAFLNAEGA